MRLKNTTEGSTMNKKTALMMTLLAFGCGAEGTTTIIEGTPCTSTEDGDGCVLIECPDSNPFALCGGEDGATGDTGDTGQEGSAGTSCTVVQVNESTATITCGTDVVTITAPTPPPPLGDLCDPSVNPCENGSYCTWDPGSPGWTWDRPYCFACSTPFAGYDCEILDPCLDADPCQNGATCSTERVSVFDLPFTVVWGATTCECPSGFSGEFCETPDSGPVDPVAVSGATATAYPCTASSCSASTPPRS
jgi:hypothetical protein